MNSSAGFRRSLVKEQKKCAYSRKLGATDLVTATNLARTNRLPGLGCLFDGSLARLPVRLAQMKGGHWSLEIAREGADVAFSYLSEHQDAKKTESLVAEAGRKAALLPGDIGERSISE